MSHELVHLEVDGPVATISLDSPHNRNALSRQLTTELDERLVAAEATDGVRAVVLRATGRVFCSGADLTEATGEGMTEGARRIVALQRRIVALEVPVVAAVQGPVRAGGLGLVAAADVAVGAHEATFALTEVRLGLAAAVISLTLRDRLGPRAMSLATLGGETFDGATAAGYGLLTEAVPGERLDARVAQVCEALAKGDPQGLRESKRLLNADLLARFEARGEELAETSARLFASDAAQQAMRSFLAR